MAFRYFCSRSWCLFWRDWAVRNNSLWTLSRIHADPALCLPVLIEGLDDSDRTARENAAIALGHYGHPATSAIPSRSTTIKINSAAGIAISQITAMNGSGGNREWRPSPGPPRD